MTKDVLIPFGIHSDTGKMIEPEDAQKGRACGCVCPSCKAPLLARHPKIKKKHFAHDSRLKDATPSEDCSFSPEVAVAMMIRAVHADFIGKYLVLPEHSTYINCSEYLCSIEVKISDRSLIEVTGSDLNQPVDESSHQSDLTLLVKGYPIHIFFEYDNHGNIPTDPKILNSKKFGLMVLRCAAFSYDYDTDLRFSEAVIDFLLTSEWCEWITHPREQEKKDLALANHKCPPKPKSYHEESIPQWFNHYPKPQRHRTQYTNSAIREAIETRTISSGRFPEMACYCERCSTSFKSSTSLYCPDCGHLGELAQK